ncbi:MAG: peptidoglycan DD-metalloendopeptidase family protein [Spirochaetales bacterium]|nr:peptidoglycan DD-metalloendopeptidase family protein [Spirochaetales bacterium]
MRKILRALGIILFSVMGLVSLHSIRVTESLKLSVQNEKATADRYKEKADSLEANLKIVEEAKDSLEKELESTKKNMEYLTALSPLKGLVSEDEINELIKEIPHGNPFRCDFIVTSKFGERTLDHGVNIRTHTGVDIIPVSDEWIITPIDSGAVESYGYDAVYGKYVYVRHSDRVRTFSAHGETIYNRGTTGHIVDDNTAIMYMGDTGYSKGKHLHFEIQVWTGERWQAVNPLPFLEG